MNDAIRELLSAYLDGALDEDAKRDVEERLARSPELRAELESLKAVSDAVKGLPRAKLPAGFQARLQSRILREGSAPAREYFILPPAYRPVAFALSSAIVAMVVWDKARGPVSPERTLWDGAETVAMDRVAVKTAAEAPASIDLSSRLGSAGSPEAAADKKEDVANTAGVSPAGRRAAAPGKPLEITEDAASLAAVRGAGGAGAAGGPAAPSAAVPSSPAAVDAAEGTFLARSEEERSAMNERLYQNFEQEKKRMGIAQIIEKDSEDEDDAGYAAFRRQIAAEAEAAPKRERKLYGTIGAVRGRDKIASKAKDAPSPEDAPAAAPPPAKALALKSAESLAAAWGGAGLPGEPPAVKFPAEMAVFLACSTECGIVDVQERKRLLVVLYKETGYPDAAARVRAVPASAKPVVVKRVP